MNKIFSFMFNSDFRFNCLSSKGLYKKMPDEEYLKHLFRAKMGYELKLDNPVTYNEKLQWLKIHDRNPLYTLMVDKYEAKKLVADIIGDKYIIPTLGVWNDFEDINFEKLPNQFVLKCTHDSGGLVICRDKSKFDKKKARRIINKSLKRNYYYKYREWPYKSVKPRIIAEMYLEENSNGLVKKELVLKDYKLQCFDGKFDSIFVAEGRYSRRGVRYHYFDRNWNYLPYCPYDDINIKELVKLKPQCYEEMIWIAETLSVGLPQLRVDLYEINGKVYFGEMTFFSQGGFDTSITPQADNILGSKLNINNNFL